MTKQTNRVLLILDRSSSMGSMRAEAIAAMNEQIKTLKEESDQTLQTYVSVFTFSTNTDKPLMLHASVDDLEEITEEDYVPSGMTAMLDAIGRAIDTQRGLRDVNDPDTSFLVTIISDGQENNSKEHTYASIGKIIRELQDTGRWTFTYLGANQNLADISRSTGIPLANMSGWDATPAGMADSTTMHTSSTRDYYDARKRGEKSISNFYDKSGDKSGKGDKSAKSKSKKSADRSEPVKKKPNDPNDPIKNFFK